MSDPWQVPIDVFPQSDAGQIPALRPAILEEVIGGVDSRVQETNTTAFPAMSVAQLVLTTRDGTVTGATGTFITNRVLLTAAHAVFIPGSGTSSGMIREMVVIPGRNGAQRPFGAVQAVDFYVPALWQSHQLPDSDYALFYVPPWQAARPYRPVAASDSELRGLAVRIAGYPLDKDPGTQWSDQRRILDVTQGQVAYDVDTMRGQSGSAVAHLQNGGAFIVAIHRFGTEQANFGTRITDPILQDIRGRV